jgi:addiction module RelB/DinJ family antitoxin
MDESLKGEFETLCNEFGMNMTTAINVFARAVVRERRIPFDIASADTTRAAACDAFRSLRAKATSGDVADMTAEEIDEEIRKARYGEKE